jgi:hypothetical protein
MSAFTNPQTTGTTMYNQDVLNIVDLQNVANPNGTSVDQQITTLTQQLAAITSNLSVTTTGSITYDSNATETVLSNASALSYDLKVYGTVYASNYNSLCPLVFAAGGKETIWVTEERNVGINVSSPQATLHVGGNVLIDGGAEIRGTTVFTDAVVFNEPVTFNDDVYIKGRLFLNGSEIRIYR